MSNDFGSNPLINQQSHHYVVDLALQHPLIASDRMEYLLRSHLKSAFDRTCIYVRSKGDASEVTFAENLRLHVPSECFGDQSWMVERICTTRPLTESAELATLMANQ